MMYKLEDRVLFDAALPVDCEIVADVQDTQDVNETDNEATEEAATNAESNITESESSQQSEVIDRIDEFVSDSSIDLNELYIIDTSISEYETLLNEIPDGAQVVKVSPLADGLSFVSSKIAEYQQLDAIHIISHGSTGKLILGNNEITTDNLEAYADEFKAWNSSLAAGGDIILYGCNIAAGDGEALVEAIAQLTDADIAASSDQTGIDGNWEMEFITGQIETELLSVNDYLYNLDNRTLIVTTVADEAYDGNETFADQTAGEASGKLSLREAIGIANNDTANSYTIIFHSDLAGQTLLLGDSDGNGTHGAAEAPVEIDITTNLIIDGGDQDITVDGGWDDKDGDGIWDNGEGGSRVFNFINTSATLKNFTIEHGAGINAQGGAIYFGGVSGSATLTITGMTFNENVSQKDGGAINVDRRGFLNVSGSTFTNNTARYGGALFAYNKDMGVSNSTFYGNLATRTEGGDAIKQNGSGGTASIDHCTFVNHGAAITGRHSVSNSLFTDTSVTASATVLTGIAAGDYFEDVDGQAGISATDLQLRGGPSTVFALRNTATTQAAVIDKATGSTTATDQRGSEAVDGDLVVGAVRDLGSCEWRLAPELSSNLSDDTFSLEENSPLSTVLAILEADGAVISLATSSASNDNSSFELGMNGAGETVLTFKPTVVLDYESLPADKKFYTVALVATDSVDPALTDNLTLTIAISDVEEAAPEIAESSTDTNSDSANYVMDSDQQEAGSTAEAPLAQPRSTDTTLTAEGLLTQETGIATNVTLFGSESGDITQQLITGRVSQTAEISFSQLDNFLDDDQTSASSIDPLPRNIQPDQNGMIRLQDLLMLFELEELEELKRDADGLIQYEDYKQFLNKSTTSVDLSHPVWSNIDGSEYTLEVKDMLAAPFISDFQQSMDKLLCPATHA